MEDFNDKLSALLSNPQLMQQIMSIAQSVNGMQGTAAQPGKNDNLAQNSRINPDAILKISELMGSTEIDPKQRSLLKALIPYVGNQKIQKLERSMRAARLANMASGFFMQSKP